MTAAAPVEGGPVSVGHDLDLYIESAGHGDLTLLLVPGWTLSGEVFRHQLSCFRDSDRFRIVTVDPRSHGRSRQTTNGHHYDQHGRDLHALIETLDLQQLVLGGWSFGTLAVLSYVQQFGAGKLAGLILLDGPARVSGQDNQSEWVTFREDDADGSVDFYTREILRDRDTMNEVFAAWLLEQPQRETIDWLVDISNRVPARVAAHLCETAVPLDYSRTLAKLADRIPLLYFMRSGRGQVAREWARQHTPAARVEELGGHMMFYERSTEFNALLIDFLNDCRIPLP